MTSHVSAGLPVPISADRPTDDELLAARLVPLPRPGQWASAAVLLVLFAMLVNTLLTNYAKIFAKWGVPDTAVTSSALNPTASF